MQLRSALRGKGVHNDSKVSRRWDNSDARTGAINHGRLVLLGQHWARDAESRAGKHGSFDGDSTTKTTNAGSIPQRGRLFSELARRVAIHDRFSVEA